MANVDQYVDGYEHHMSQMDFDNSNWGEDVGPVNYVGVTYFSVKPGHSSGFAASISKLSGMAKAGGWERNWAWGQAVSGPNQVYLANAHADYASMAPPETSFAEFLAKQMDSKDDAMAALSEFSSHVSDSYYVLYRARSDLSMPLDG